MPRSPRETEKIHEKLCKRTNRAATPIPQQGLLPAGHAAAGAAGSETKLEEMPHGGRGGLPRVAAAETNSRFTTLLDCDSAESERGERAHGLNLRREGVQKYRKRFPTHRWDNGPPPAPEGSYEENTECLENETAWKR